ncbi:hypothetical protein PV08_09897 [Exophiala spinifera]|uniref:Uncharacterized protein n=1 Tax=Exophiala spinifera TaxID=91928 RepID=A0A0D2BNB9_9EURO|nr:uncharacterized protein PV08_09897 [Exophiala spinifera]KIW12619.1 hypothetical protein PV08_09897 [Exophiala spinifera]
MVLDPVSALGAAAAIIQFLDFGCKLLSKQRDLAESSQGTLIEHEELLAVTRRVAELNGQIQNCDISRDNTKKPTQAESALREVSEECRKIAAEFQHVLEGISGRPGQSSFKSFRQAFKIVWHKEGIETMQRRLDQQRSQLILHLLVVISGNQKRDIGSLLDESQRVEISILQAIRDSNAELKSYLVNHLARERTHASRESAQTLSTQKQNALSIVATDITSRIGVDNEEHARNLILDSLYFQQIEERRLRIHPAHEKTCRWVFNKPDEGANTGHNFRTWLEDQLESSGLYWVSGKIGSGKSTLMRFIYEAEETKLAAHVWSKPLPLLTASCFFWLAGTEMQKSRCGLLRSLIHDLLRQAPDLIPIAAPSRWRAATLGSNQQSWTNTELETTLLKLLENGNRDYRFCIFVDGLDEFEGDQRCHSDLVEFLVKLSSCCGVKLCVSSRRYPVFESGFEDFPQLRMERLTRKDIEAFVVDQLGEIKEFGTLEAAYPSTCNDVIKEIVEKAQGVFLWVYLVIRSLKQGLIEGDSMAVLVTRLRELPPDLDELYRRILQSIPSHQRHYAAACFQIVLGYSGLTIPRMSLMTLWFLEEETLDFAAATPVEPLAKDIIRSRHLMLIRRVEGRCRGLLEVFELGDKDTPAEYSVDYLHRSVRDFLMSRSAQRLLALHLEFTFDTRRYLCQAFFAQLKMSFPPNHPESSDDKSLERSRAVFYGLFLSQLREWTASPSTLQPEVFQAMVSLINDYGYLFMPDDIGSMKRLFRDLIDSGDETHVMELIPKHNEVDLDLSLQLFDLIGTSVIRGRADMYYRVIIALLENGANPNQKESYLRILSTTPWTGFLKLECDPNYKGRHPSSLTRPGGQPQSEDGRQQAFLAARAFIEHGAAIRTPSGQSCLKLIHKAFPGSDGDELVSLLEAKSRPKSRFHRATQKLLGRGSV